MNKKENFIQNFLTSDKEFPVLAAIAAGLYPVLFYYSRNFDMLNSWGHFFYFTGLFILLPIVIFVAAHKLSKIGILKPYHKYVLPFLNIFAFLFILKTVLFVPIEKKIIVFAFIIAILFARFFHKHLKKAIVIELILAAIGIFTMLQIIYEKATYNDAWMVQPDEIEDVVFKKKPDVYFIQPDGYVSFETLKSDPYKIENKSFESFLENKNFKTYPKFRTNYKSTLSSNSATFMMKHHYYDFELVRQEVENARNLIISDNPVLNSFKKNGYETYFLSESFYFLLNRPKLGYDHSNIDYSVIPFLHNHVEEREPVIAPFSEYLQDGIEKPKFFFLQILRPAHIVVSEGNSEGKESERTQWIERLQESNKMMEKLISHILERDPEALIMIMADHGGFVGLNYTTEGDTKTDDTKIINSIFSSNLTIHWPENNVPKYDSLLKTNVNVFRILFSYLSENEKYLKNLQPDDSYIVLTKGTEPGVYKYIDNEGKYTSEKIEQKK